jgi:RNA polymerase sigma-70 factor (ECF subfamily)
MEQGQANGKNQQAEREFVAAYDAYSEAIFRFCYFKTSDRELSKDLMQQAFAKTWEHMRPHSLTDSAMSTNAVPIVNIRAFLYKIANNLIIDWYRKRKEQSLDTMTEDGFDPVDQTMRTDKRAELGWMMRALGKLDPDDRNLIIWNYLEDIPYSDIARILDEKPTTISVRIHRAIGRMKKILKTDEKQNF